MVGEIVTHLHLICCKLDYNKPLEEQTYPELRVLTEDTENIDF